MKRKGSEARAKALINPGVLAIMESNIKTPAEDALIRAALAYCKVRAEYQAAHMETPEEHAAHRRMIKAQAAMDRAAARVLREREGRKHGQD